MARAIRNAIRANRFARIIRTWNPYFYSASGRFAWITRISDSRESPDSRESCESIRANHATKLWTIRGFGGSGRSAFFVRVGGGLEDSRGGLWLKNKSLSQRGFPPCLGASTGQPGWRFGPEKKKDASFLLTVEVFLLTVRLFHLQWGNRKQKRPNPISGRGEP